MAYRLAAVQNLHDRIVRGVYNIFKNEGYICWKNENQEKNKDFFGVYPDVIVQLKGNSNCWLFEVETSDSINDTESEQWVKYSKLFPFHLVIPESDKTIVENWIKGNGITNIFIVTYVYDKAADRVTYTGLPGH